MTCERCGSANKALSAVALIEAARNNLLQPVVQAMAWPCGMNPDDESDLHDATLFGFDFSVSTTSLDGPPKALKELDGGAS